MSHLTAQEVIERINNANPPVNDQRTTDNRSKEPPHRPEFYIPRITRRVVNFIFSGWAKVVRLALFAIWSGVVRVIKRNASSNAALILVFVLVVSIASYTQNQVLGEVQFVTKTKTAKTSGVWIDGQYVGYAAELKDDKKVWLLPGEHEISVHQSGYMDFTQKVVVEPGKKVILHVSMQKDPRVQFPTVTSQLKLQVTPERAAVFVDDGFVGTVREFSGVGRAMLVSPGKHRVKIALPGYQAFDTEVNLLPKQKITIKTNLVPGSITEAGPSIKKD